MAKQARTPKTAAPAPRRAEWERDQFAARLTAARRARLLRIAESLPEGATPVQAFDRAIELALSARAADASHAERLDSLGERADRVERQAAESARELREAVAETLLGVRDIARLMSAVAAGAPDELVDGSPGEAGSASRASPLRAWLDSEARGRDRLAATARWRSKSRLSDRMVAMDFEVEAAGAAARRALVRVEPVDAASPLAGADAFPSLSLECRRAERGGWIVSARAAAPGRAAGQPLGEFRA